MIEGGLAMRTPIWLDKRAFLTPDRIAVEADSEQLTFAQLRQRAVNRAVELLALGVQQGHTVACLSESSVSLIEVVHSIPYTGAMLMLLNTRLTAHELMYQLQDSNSSLLLYSDSFAELAIELHRANKQLQVVSLTELQAIAAVAESRLLRDVSEQSTYTIMYTSGTTGAPKGVLQSYYNHWSSAIGSALNLGLGEQDKWLVTLPLFHISGLSILLRSVIYGIPIVLHTKFTPEEANKTIMNQGVTIMSVVSTMLTRMLEQLGENFYPSTFRCMLLGGGPAPLALLQSCVEHNIPVMQTYGMTETCSQFATLSPQYMLSKLGSAGKPLFQSDLRIMGSSGEELPAGEAGEIVVQGPNVSKGYYHHPASDSYHNGWLYTGDVGYVDEEGFLYVLDRRKDLIISGGENVYPAEIEAMLVAHSDILEAGVTAVADEQWGQRPVAFVVMSSGKPFDAEQLKVYCSQRLAKYKLPSAIYAVDELPRNAAGKLLRRELLGLLP
jgi:O-succinylbenzoic acid--CoA ligase